MVNFVDSCRTYYSMFKINLISINKVSTVLFTMNKNLLDPSTENLTQEKKWEAFKCYLTESGHRITQQRRHIFDAAINCHDHCTAEQLLGRARQTDPSVSRATVYRTLPILVKSHVMREIDVGKDYKYYTAKQEKANFQAQIVCVNCDKIFEIDAPFMEWYGK